MADVTLVLPPSQVTTVSAGGQQTSSATEAGVQPPGLPPGTLVSGTIAGRDANGNFILKSNLGSFTLHSDVPLTYNSDVVIRLGANLAGNANARIVSVNGQPFSEFSTPEPATSDSVSTSLIAQATSNAEKPASIRTLPAVIISSSPQHPTDNAALPEGTHVVVNLPEGVLKTVSNPAPSLPAGPATPQSQTAAGQVASPLQTGNAATPATVTTANASVPAPFASQNLAPQTAATPLQAQTGQNPALQANTVNTAQTQSPLPATQTPPSPVAALYSVYTKQQSSSPPAASAIATPQQIPAQPSVVPAQILSSDESGILTLQTPLGNVTLQADALPALASLAPGTSVSIELPAANTLPQAGNTVPASLTELAGSWQSLKDIISTLNAANAPAASTLLARLPQLGANFVSESLNFMASLLQGDARKLLGDDAVNTLRSNGRQDLIGKFSGEIANLSSGFSAPEQKPVTGWQTLFLPFVYQEALQQARVYIKRDNRKKEAAATKATADTRFVVEVDLSEIGGIQMDGLVRKKEQATAFDLVIRSHHAFGKQEQEQILSIYNEAAELTGFKGSLSFQVTRDFTVKPLEEVSGGEDHSFTV